MFLVIIHKYFHLVSASCMEVPLIQLDDETHTMQNDDDEEKQEKVVEGLQII